MQANVINRFGLRYREYSPAPLPPPLLFPVSLCEQCSAPRPPVGLVGNGLKAKACDS